MRPPSNASDAAALPKLAWLSARPPLVQPSGYQLVVFEDSDEFLLDSNAFDFDFYVVDVVQRGVSGIDLIRLIRRHGSSGILATEAPPLPNFRTALDSGADIVVADTASPGHFESAINAVRRRVSVASATHPGPWRLSETTLLLTAPSGAVVALSESDLKILSCFVASAGRPVDRGALMAKLWGVGSTGMDNALQANIYRLRKRLETLAPESSPIRAVARAGYEFRGSIVWN